MPHTATIAPTTALRVQTLGGFRVWREGEVLADWKREKAVQLFQYLVAHRGVFRHKEHMIEQLWPLSDAATGDRDFKVAMNALTKALEPGRTSRAASRYIERVGSTYALRADALWLDLDAFEQHVHTGNRLLRTDPAAATEAYRAAADLYAGPFLPERRYEDWSAVTREHAHTMALSTMTTLAQLLLDDHPLESLHLASRVRTFDATWEAAYRVQMQAYLRLGNRPAALRTYEQCADTLAEAYDVDPLPQTQDLYVAIKRQG